MSFLGIGRAILTRQSGMLQCLSDMSQGFCMMLALFWRQGLVFHRFLVSQGVRVQCIHMVKLSRDSTPLLRDIDHGFSGIMHHLLWNVVHANPASTSTSPTSTSTSTSTSVDARWLVFIACRYVEDSVAIYTAAATSTSTAATSTAATAATASSSFVLVSIRSVRGIIHATTLVDMILYIGLLFLYLPAHVSEFWVLVDGAKHAFDTIDVFLKCIVIPTRSFVDGLVHILT